MVSHHCQYCNVFSWFTSELNSEHACPEKENAIYQAELLVQQNEERAELLAAREAQFDALLNQYEVDDFSFSTRSRSGKAQTRTRTQKGQRLILKPKKPSAIQLQRKSKNKVNRHENIIFTSLKQDPYLKEQLTPEPAQTKTEPVQTKTEPAQTKTEPVVQKLPSSKFVIDLTYLDDDDNSNYNCSCPHCHSERLDNSYLYTY